MKDREIFGRRAAHRRLFHRVRRSRSIHLRRTDRETFKGTWAVFAKGPLRDALRRIVENPKTYGDPGSWRLRS